MTSKKIEIVRVADRVVLDAELVTEGTRNPPAPWALWLRCGDPPAHWLRCGKRHSPH